MKHRISPATAISLVALFFSLTGAGFAASRYLITSVSQIKPRVREALRGAQGPQGPQGPAGAPGAQGPSGASGTLNLTTGSATPSQSVTLTPDNPAASFDVNCPPGLLAVSGSFSSVNAIVTHSGGVGPYSTSGWEIAAHLENAQQPGFVYMWALCVRAS